MKHKIIIGLGNPIVADDAVGFRVAVSVGERLGLEQIRCQVIDLDLLDELEGYDEAVFIDAMQTGKRSVGEVVMVKEESMRELRYYSSPHSLNLPSILDLGRQLGLSLPRVIRIYGIEVQDVVNYSESLTPAVAAAVPRIVDYIVERERT